ncbi:hypothetical protein TYRP_006233 [Tyrophagus putrescentiae]|nr:hypothetical protein TYRP_006233 [Tyrophagus putrescentiae]
MVVVAETVADGGLLWNSPGASLRHQSAGPNQTKSMRVSRPKHCGKGKPEKVLWSNSLECFGKKRDFGTYATIIVVVELK